ncbi:uncharacterized protein LOC102078727 isoform X2 [Oreochromis niloticus]|uniref:uncharacterized protein LOC102078727 isoform X2 n=1 Tax=Oreochromis niloticus TaxID=8128 RepID=UPI0003946BB1|nr:uncharacterized protein LOC102078727 isoform X2 [Oreochromis niloticus]
MKILLCCLLLLPFADMVVAASIKGQSSKEDALAVTTERTTPAAVTAQRTPLCGTVNKQDSDDISDAKSTESSETNRCPEPDAFDKNGDESRDVSKDLDSDEIMIPGAVAKNEAPSRKETVVGKDSMAAMDITSSLVQDHGNREHSLIEGELQASRDSEEGGITNAREGGGQSTNLQRWATRGKVNGMSGMLVHGQIREGPNWDSLEDSSDSLAGVSTKKQTDYDETREYMSSETYPVVPQERSSLPTPSKNHVA